MDIKERIKELKASLKLYKEALGDEVLTVKQEMRTAPKVGEVRVVFLMPEEYVLITHVEEDGLVHAVPLTTWTSLSTVFFMLKVDTEGWRETFLRPLPFLVYLRKEWLELHSYPIAEAEPATIQRVLRAVDRALTWSAWRPIREFLRLNWKRWEKLTLGSLFYTHDLREKGEV
jgi:hypothetical protein